MTTVNVASAAALMPALAVAKGGDTLLLAPGNYGTLDLSVAIKPWAKYPSQVTIRSADPARMASFSRMKLNGVTNLTFDAIKFDYEVAPAASVGFKPFTVATSSGIAFLNSLFDGDLAEGLDAIQNGTGTGIGLNVSESSNITLKGSTFCQWWKGATFGNSSGIKVIGNDISDLRSDGLNFASVADVLIEANHIHDFKKAIGSGDHGDFIQFFVAVSGGINRDITIRANFLNTGGGDTMQCLFMRNQPAEGLSTTEKHFLNILIEHNLIHAAHTHGITVGETTGLAVRNNTLLHNADSSPYQPQINRDAASQDVDISKNVAERLGPNVLAGNLLVQRADPAKPNYLDALFVNPRAGKLATLADLRAKPGGLIEQGSWGAAMTRASVTAPAPVAPVLAPTTATRKPRRRK